MIALLLFPLWAHALTAPELMGAAQTASNLCTQAKSIHEKLSTYPQDCIDAKICRDAIRDVYAPLLTECEKVNTFFRDLTATLKCPKQPTLGCAFDFKTMQRADQISKDLKKAIQKNLKTERIDRACEPYDDAFRTGKYGTCPKKGDVAFLRDMQHKLLAETRDPLVTLLKKLAAGELK